MADPREAPTFSNLAESETISSPVMNTYARQNVIFERGEGAWLFAKGGEAYLDFASGVAVNAFGHSHPALVAALSEQAQKVWHTSNLYRVAGQETVAEKLTKVTFADRVFFCNSGAEACEGAIKTARRFHFTEGAPHRWKIITFEGAFHGRTLATISAGGNRKYMEGFGEPVGGFVHVPLGDINAVKSLINFETAGIMIEPIQGEGGVREASSSFLKSLRAICDEYGLLLIFDEVQCGMGRTGRLFAHEWSYVKPDIMAIAKGLGGGFPVGAFLATENAAKGMTPGTHGSTFGGNPLATAVAKKVIDLLLEKDFLDTVCGRGYQLASGLNQIQKDFPNILLEIRGKGLLVGLKISLPVSEVVKHAFEQKLLCVGASDNVLRLLPPLNISETDVNEGLSRLRRTFVQVSKVS
ncbi:MAG: aspartate aminotransferase family protein [Hyphomicrobium sp.]